MIYEKTKILSTLFPSENHYHQHHWALRLRSPLHQYSQSQVFMLDFRPYYLVLASGYLIYVKLNVPCTMWATSLMKIYISRQHQKKIASPSNDVAWRSSRSSRYIHFHMTCLYSILTRVFPLQLDWLMIID